MYVGDAGNDRWVVFALDASGWPVGAEVNVSAGMLTFSGQPVATTETWTVVMGETAVSVQLVAADADVSAMPGAVGEPMSVQPGLLHAGPQRIWLPAPKDAEPNALKLLLEEHFRRCGLVPRLAHHGVASARQPGSRHQDSRRVPRRQATHGGSLCLGPEPDTTADTAGFPNRRNIATLAVVAGTALALVVLGSRRRHTQP